MKSEHRHELQTNELGKFAEKMAVFIDVHGNRLMIGVCLACLPLAAFIYWWRSENNAQAAAWRDFSAAIAVDKPEEFHAVWKDHPNTTPAYWARVHEGEKWLSLGVQSMFRNVENGMEELKKAQAAFQSIVDAPRKAPPGIRDRALFGLGRTLESMSNGSEDEAVKTYEKLVQEFPDSIYKKDAEERIAVLSRGSGQEFYAWFTRFPRPKLPVKSPRDRLSGDIDEKDRKVLDEIDAIGKGEKSTDDESLNISESDKPEGDKRPAEKKPTDNKPDETDGQPDEKKPETEPKPDSVPEPESKSDEPNAEKKE
jgi:hypothetical protein